MTSILTRNVVALFPVLVLVAILAGWGRLRMGAK